jgi:integrase
MAESERGTMSVDLASAADAYLADCHARGYLLADHGWLIAAFLAELTTRGATMITASDALAFACRVPQSSKCWQATRLRAVAGLAGYIHDLDPEAADLIPPGLIRARRTRRLPYIYTHEQIDQLMTATTMLAPPLFALSVRVLIGLLAVTGMRSGEAFALNVDDLAVDRAVLSVTGKYDKQRLVPLHPSTVEVLAAYQEQRPGRSGPDSGLLFGPRGGRLNKKKARAAFTLLVASCGLPARPRCGSARLHDLRHSFAVHTLMDAHRDGADADARLATLATFLGHVEPANTYWYLSASPELMAAVAQRSQTSARRP